MEVKEVKSYILPLHNEFRLKQEIGGNWTTGRVAGEWIRLAQLPCCMYEYDIGRRKGWMDL